MGAVRTWAEILGFPAEYSGITSATCTPLPPLEEWMDLMRLFPSRLSNGSFGQIEGGGVVVCGNWKQYKHWPDWPDLLLVNLRAKYFVTFHWIHFNVLPQQCAHHLLDYNDVIKCRCIALLVQGALVFGETKLRIWHFQHFRKLHLWNLSWQPSVVCTSLQQYQRMRHSEWKAVYT